METEKKQTEQKKSDDKKRTIYAIIICVIVLVGITYFADYTHVGHQFKKLIPGIVFIASIVIWIYNKLFGKDVHIM